jgi:PGF-pre-PGF domain-containing protein
MSRLPNTLAVCAALFLLFAVSVIPAAAEEVSVVRSVPQAVFAGGEFTVTLSLEGLEVGGIIETLPEGFTFVDTDHPGGQTAVSGQSLVFSVVGEDEIAYRVRPSVGGSFTITGIWADVAGQTEGTVPATVLYVGSSCNGEDDSSSSVSSAITVATTVLPTENATVTSEPLFERTFVVEDQTVHSASIAAATGLDTSTFNVHTVDRPAGVPAVDGVVFRYLEMNLSGCPADDLTTAAIRFRADRTWIAGSNISESSVVLLRYHDGWSSLPTKRIRSGDTDTSLMYEASVPGFSLFAIAGTQIAASESGAPTRAAVTIAVPAASVVQAETDDESGGTMLPLLGGFAAIIVVIGAGVWIMRGRDNDDEVKR